MTIVSAGFNRVSGVANLDDRVITGGLANCIAIVGIDAALGSMKIAHYDTANCHNGERFTPLPLRNFRDWFGNDTLSYRVGLGGIWFDTGFPDMRHSLMMAIIDVFDYEPRVASAVISLHRSGGDFVMTGHANEALLPAGWGNSGTEIPYAQLR